MRICIIGGTGHIGRAAVPLLRDRGYDLTIISRGQSPAPSSRKWDGVKTLTGSYRRRDERWHRFIRDIDADVLIDIPGIDIPGTYREIQRKIRHYIAFGCYRMYGESSMVPTPEEAQNRSEFPELAERFGEVLGIQNQAMADGVPFTALVPTEIMGPGAVCMNGYGGSELAGHKRHASGEPIKLPMGGHSLIAPVDVDDVVRALLAVVKNPEKTAGEIFNIGPAYAITVEKFIQTLSTAYRTNIPIEYISWNEYFHEYNPERWDNYIFRSHMAPDISRLREILQFEPLIAPEIAIERAIDWIRTNNLLE